MSDEWMEKDGFPTEWFVSQEEIEEFLCPYCKYVVNDPQQCRNGHFLCCGCFEVYLKKKKRKKGCMICQDKTTSKTISRNIFVKGKVELLAVFCRRPSDVVCLWSGPLHESFKHVCIFGEDDVSSPNIIGKARFVPTEVSSVDVVPTEVISVEATAGNLTADVVIKKRSQESIVGCSDAELTRIEQDPQANGSKSLAVTEIPSAHIQCEEVLLTFCNGWYVGQVNVEEQRHGIGITISNNERGEYFDQIYAGMYVNDKRSGHGVLSLGTTGAIIYEGQWRNGLKHGQGKLFESDKQEYEGEWNKGRRHGQGKQVDRKCGIVYEGVWRGGYRHGQGRQVDSGGVYEGEWNKGRRHGRGKQVDADGTVYDGEWDNDCRYGQGTRSYTLGAVYEGGWRNDRRHGRGKEVDADGTVYEGEWKNGCRV
jgi:hypothetical protein